MTVKLKVNQLTGVSPNSCHDHGNQSDATSLVMQRPDANDYLTKPFGVNELLARLRVLLRGEARSAADSPIYEVGDLRVNLSSRQVVVRGEQLHLTPTQYRLLTTMIKHAGKVLTHRQLLKEVWGPHSVREHQYLRVYVGQIRQKIESDPTRPRYLLTESGVGYRFAAE